MTSRRAPLRSTLVLLTLFCMMYPGSGLGRRGAPERIVGSGTYRPEVVGKRGVVAAGRHFAAEAGMRMLNGGGNAIDAGVAATFAAAVSERSAAWSAHLVSGSPQRQTQPMLRAGLPTTR